MGQAASVYITDLLVQPLHDLHEGTLAQVSVGFPEANVTQVFCCNPFLPFRDRPTFKHRALRQEVRAGLTVTIVKFTLVTMEGMGLGIQFCTNGLIFRGTA